MGLMFVPIVPVVRILEHFGITTTAANDAEIPPEPEAPDPKVTGLRTRRTEDERVS